MPVKKERKSRALDMTATLSRYLFHPTSHRLYAVSSWIFIRVVALIYLIVFLWIAGNTLDWIGGAGAFPVEQTLATAEKELRAGAFLKYPTLFWYSTHDITIRVLPLVGAVLSLFLLVGIQPAGLLVALYIIFVSIASVSEPFLSSSCFLLLLETGFLTTFLTSFNSWMPFRRTPPPPRGIHILFVWLFFRALLTPPLFLVINGRTENSSIKCYLLYFLLLLSLALFFISDSLWTNIFRRDQLYIEQLGGNKYRGFSLAIRVFTSIIVVAVTLLTLYNRLLGESEGANSMQTVLGVLKPFGLANIYRF